MSKMGDTGVTKKEHIKLLKDLMDKTTKEVEMWADDQETLRELNPLYAHIKIAQMLSSIIPLIEGEKDIKKDESIITIKMHKQSIMEVFVSTKDGKRCVVDTPVHYKRTFVVPIQTTDVGVISLYIGG